MPYEIFADVSMVTFASGREGLLLWKRYLEMLVNHVMVFQFCRPVWDLWIRYALVTGMLDGSVQDYRGVRWVAPPLEMLDARAEVLGLQMRVRNGFMSRSEAVNADRTRRRAGRGRDRRREPDERMPSAWFSIAIRAKRRRKVRSSPAPWKIRRRPQVQGGNDDAVIN